MDASVRLSERTTDQEATAGPERSTPVDGSTGEIEAGPALGGHHQRKPHQGQPDQCNGFRLPNREPPKDRRDALRHHPLLSCTIRLESLLFWVGPDAE